MPTTVENHRLKDLEAFCGFDPHQRGLLFFGAIFVSDIQSINIIDEW